MSSTKSGPYRAAVTSSLGAGKSTMLDFASKRGFHTLSTDALTHELLNEPNPAYDKILARFGSQLVDKVGGPINRPKLAEIVFSDARARKELEEIIHPAILATCNERIAKLAPDAIVFVEVPLLFEKNLGSHYHETLALTVKPEVQMARLLTRPNTTKEHAQRRIDSQLSQREKSLRADYIIDNSGELGTFQNSLDIYFKGVRERAAKRLLESTVSKDDTKTAPTETDTGSDTDLTKDKTGPDEDTAGTKTKKTAPLEPERTVPLDPVEAKRQSDQLRGMLKDFVPVTGDMALKKMGDVGTTKHKEASARLTLNVDTRDCDESGKKCSDHTHEIGVDVHMWVKQKHGKSTAGDTCGCGCGKTCRSGCACSSGCGCTCPVPPPVTPPPVTPPPVTPLPPVPPVTPPPHCRPWYRRGFARCIMLVALLCFMSYVAYLATLVYLQSTHIHAGDTGTGTVVTTPVGKTPVGTGKDPTPTPPPPPTPPTQTTTGSTSPTPKPLCTGCDPAVGSQWGTVKPAVPPLALECVGGNAEEHLTDVPSFAFAFTPNWVRARATAWVVTYQDGCSTASVVGVDKDNNVVSEQEYRKGLTFVNRYDINRQGSVILVDHFESFGQFVGRTTYSFDALEQLISIDRFDGHAALLANARASGTGNNQEILIRRYDALTGKSVGSQTYTGSAASAVLDDNFYLYDMFKNPRDTL